MTVRPVGNRASVFRFSDKDERRLQRELINTIQRRGTLPGTLSKAQAIQLVSKTKLKPLQTAALQAIIRSADVFADFGAVFRRALATPSISANDVEVVQKTLRGALPGEDVDAQLRTQLSWWP